MDIVEWRSVIFMILILIGLFGALYTIYLIGLYTSTHTIIGGMYEMMRHMSGESGSYSIPSYVWFMPYIFLIILVIGFIGVLYDVKHSKSGEIKEALYPRLTTGERELKSEIEDILKVLKPDERRVVELLLENKGKMLQRDITWETGFTRLKTHRIINRLNERGIVKRIPRGNTNLIVLEDWLIKKL